MGRKIFLSLFIASIVLPLAVFGCKARVEKPAQMPMDETDAFGPITEAEIAATEPAETVATETIPPTAAPAIRPPRQAPAVQEREARNKDIQTALKNAHFYAGAIDGKIGPKTKKAIEEFQKAEGLKVDGKVGPKTWAEMEKYLIVEKAE